MIIRKNTKIIILVILILLCSFLLAFLIYSNYQFRALRLYDQNIEELKQKLDKIEPQTLNVKLNDNLTYYNELENIYYYYIDESNYYKCLDFELNIFSKSKYNYVIDYKHSERKGLCVDYYNPITVFIYNDRYYFETKLQFTSVPILNINVDEIGYFGDEAQLELYSNSSGTISYLESNALIKTRGATSMSYPKKQYRISLYKGKNKFEISFLDMDKDEDWILDAMYSDYSKIRSKLSFDLWNKMNSYTNDKINNDIELEYVDVYINNKYTGLYLLKEAVDRKLLSLDETSNTNSGILIKGNTFDVISKKEYEISKKSNIVLPFEMKYPNNSTDYSKYWDNIINRIYTYYFDKEKITEEYLIETFDLYNYIDYKIFINVIFAADNVAQKNIFLSVKNMDKNTKVIITPWDLDVTFGYGFNGKPPRLLYENYGNYKITDFIINDPTFINELLIQRYFELRENILSVEHINLLIDSYYNKIKYSAIRDSEIWGKIDLEQEIRDIKKWYKKRVEFLDEYLGEYDV